MFFFICRDPKFDEAISSLRQSGGKALFAAKKAEEIINKLTSGENRWLHEAGKFTKKGEKMKDSKHSYLVKGLWPFKLLFFRRIKDGKP